MGHSEAPRGQIRNPKLIARLRDFTGLRWGAITPTDIDGLIEFWDKAFVILEAKSGNAIVMEDLPLGFILQNRLLSRASHDTGLGMFRELLDYKAVEAGVELVTVNPRNTSQVCSACGSVVPKGLSVRVHSCPDCGLTTDRDVNAARNVLRLGRSRWALTWPVAACVAQDAPPL